MYKSKRHKSWCNCLVYEIYKRSLCVDILQFRTWANWKKAPLVVEKTSSVAWIFVLVSKNYFWLSRRNGTIWFLVGEMGVIEMRLIYTILLKPPILMCFWHCISFYLNTLPDSFQMSSSGRFQRLFSLFVLLYRYLLGEQVTQSALGEAWSLCRILSYWFIPASISNTIVTVL